MLREVERILIVRGDKIGDVILITPALKALRVVQPKAKIAVCVRGGVKDVLKGNPNISELIVWEDLDKGGLLGFIRMVLALRRKKFQVSVLMQGTFRISLAIFLAAIPFRIGGLSKWWSWIFLNMGIRQNRSNVEMHEADYNLQLLRDLGVIVAQHRYRPEIAVDPIQKLRAGAILEEKNVSSNFPLVAIHPGMAGSALNWPERYYIQLGRRLVKKYNVLITGGPNEKDLVDRVHSKIERVHSYESDAPILSKYIGAESLGEFISIVSSCDAIVVPSTGPMHIAVGVGTRVLTIFSPIRVQSGLRWGPYGIPHGTNLGVSPRDKSSILVPDVNCAEGFKCAGTACMYYPCMPRISVEDVEVQLDVLLGGGEISMVKSSKKESGSVPLDEDLEEDRDADEEMHS